MRRIYFVISLNFWLAACQQQPAEQTKQESDAIETLSVEIDQTAVDYSLLVRDSNEYRVLAFYKHKDSTVYNHLKYSCSCGDSVMLHNEVGMIKKLWRLAEDSIQIDLRSVDVGYPYVFDDVLARHIEVFNIDERWQQHVATNGRELDYDLIRQIMIDQKVYKSLNELLAKKGFQIHGLSTEKHGFIVKEDLQRLGYKGDEIIPMPFIVIMTVAPATPTL